MRAGVSRKQECFDYRFHLTVESMDNYTMRSKSLFEHSCTKYVQSYSNTASNYSCTLYDVWVTLELKSPDTQIDRAYGLGAAQCHVSTIVHCSNILEYTYMQRKQITDSNTSFACGPQSSGTICLIQANSLHKILSITLANDQICI